MRYVVLFGLLSLVGCASVEQGAYRPVKSKEKQAFARADRGVAPADVKKNFRALENTEVAWAGIIKDVQFNETERTFQVAFEVEHRGFDWKDHGGGAPFRLSSEGDGLFRAGWVVDKPTRISYLKMLAGPGDMLIVYGKPYRMKDWVIQLAATAIRPVRDSDFIVVEPVAEAEGPDPVVEAEEPVAEAETPLVEGSE
jgi:hypothetical protein